MKVLFYVEPHIIRKNENAFVHAAKLFLPLIKTSQMDGYEAMLYTNSNLLSKINSDDYKEIGDRFIRPSESEEQIFSSGLKLSEESDTDLWLEIISGKGFAKFYQEILSRIYQKFQFDVIVHWGENGAIKNFAKQNSIYTIGIEQGCTRNPFKDTLAIDPFGTNGSTLVPKLKVNDIIEIVDGESMTSEQALLCFGTDNPSHSYASIFSPIDSEILSRINNTRKTVFLPLQLYDDINLIHFSKYKTLSEVLLDVVPKLAKANYTVIIKTHPLSSTRQRGHVENEIAKNSIKPWLNSVIWLDKNISESANSQLILNTAFTVTVNSSVGFEATFFNKPVVVLGEAVYKPMGLFPTLSNLLNGQYDHNLYLKNLGFLRRFMIGSYLQPRSILSNKSYFINFIFNIIHGHINGNGNPSIIAKRIYESQSTRTLINSRYPNYSNLAYDEKFSEISPIEESILDASRYAKKSIVQNLVKHSNSKNYGEFSNWIRSIGAKKLGLLEILELGKVLDPQFYISTYQDIKESNINPYEHYANYGINESRAPQYAVMFESKNDLIDQIIKAYSELFPK